jgi:hypothetical protein
MVVPSRRRVTNRPVSMRHTMMPTLGRIEILPHQRPALAVAHDLPVTQAVAPADRLARGMRRPLMRLRPPMSSIRGATMCLRDAMMRLRGVMARAQRAMVAHVDPAVARARPGHRWKRRRWRQRLGLGGERRLGPFGHRLRGWRSPLVGPGLLRRRRRLLRRDLHGGQRRRDHNERKCRAGNDDTPHDILPSPPNCLRQAEQITG